MMLLFTESIDESGLTGSSIGQRQQADSGDAPKLAFRLRQIGGCLESRFIRKFRRAHLVYCPKERLLRQRNAIGRNDSRQARTWAPRFSRVPQNALAELQLDLLGESRVLDNRRQGVYERFVSGPLKSLKLNIPVMTHRGCSQ